MQEISSDKTAAFKFNRVCKQKTVDESEEAAPRELIVLKNGASEQKEDLRGRFIVSRLQSTAFCCLRCLWEEITLPKTCLMTFKLCCVASLCKFQLRKG